MKKIELFMVIRYQYFLKGEKKIWKILAGKSLIYLLSHKTLRNRME